MQLIPPTLNDFFCCYDFIRLKAQAADLWLAPYPPLPHKSSHYRPASSTRPESVFITDADARSGAG